MKEKKDTRVKCKNPECQKLISRYVAHHNGGYCHLCFAIKNRKGEK